MRYRPDGTPDPDFGAGGVVRTQVGNNGHATIRDLALQDDGKIVAVGFARDNDIFKFGIVRYRSDGTPDPAFDGDGNNDGMVLTQVGGGNNSANGVLVQPDGKIAVAGYAAPDSNTGVRGFALARYTSAGALDPTFSPDGQPGTVITQLGYEDGDDAYGLARTPDGGYVAAGSTGDDTQGDDLFDFAVARYREDGTLDTSFNPAGALPGTTQTAIGGTDEAFGNAVLVQPDGRIVVTGAARIGTDPDTYAFALARYNPSGDLDTDWGGAGTVLTVIGQTAEGADAVLQPDGKIVAAGFAVENQSVRFALARYLVVGDDGTDEESVEPGSADRRGELCGALTPQPAC